MKYLVGCLPTKIMCFQFEQQIVLGRRVTIRCFVVSRASINKFVTSSSNLDDGKGHDDDR
jgi:hypothetical protein